MIPAAMHAADYASRPRADAKESVIVDLYVIDRCGICNSDEHSPHVRGRVIVKEEVGAAVRRSDSEGLVARMIQDAILDLNSGEDPVEIDPRTA